MSRQEEHDPKTSCELKQNRSPSKQCWLVCGIPLMKEVASGVLGDWKFLLGVSSRHDLKLYGTVNLRICESGEDELARRGLFGDRNLR